MLNNQPDLFISLKNFETEVMNKTNYSMLWNSLLDAEKAILLAIIHKINNFYSENFYTFALSLSFELTNSKIQNAIKKLHSRNFIISLKDTYVIEDLFFEKWITNNVSTQ